MVEESGKVRWEEGGEIGGRKGVRLVEERGKVSWKEEGEIHVVVGREREKRDEVGE